MCSKEKADREALLRAFKHPLRIRILEFSIRKPGQALSASELKDVLERDGEHLKVSELAYHLARLQEVELIPRPIRGG